MKLTTLASGSKGNCYILESRGEKLLLECGINFKEIQKGLNFDYSNVVGCLITHEHKDHCKAINELMNAGIDCYLSNGTADALGIDSHRLHRRAADTIINLGLFIIKPFIVEHDAKEPFGYLIFNSKTGEKLLFATDTYYLKYKFNNLNYILIECNYCKDILDENIAQGKIPNSLKNRLLESHFSLEHVKEMLQANDLRSCKKIVLLHLSDGNSDSMRMIHEIKELTGVKTEVAAASEIINLN